ATGALVDGHDPQRWADTIGTLLAGDLDALGRAAVTHAQEFSWDHTVDDLLAAYHRAVTDYTRTHRRPSARDLATRRGARRWSRRR
ncbi:hypothetical protein ABTO49_21405, partial [Acinetobacter baumannii]